MAGRNTPAKKKPVEKAITCGDSILFAWRDPTPGGGNLGRAEFAFCPIWRRGRMVELLIYPKQQRVSVDCYRLDLLGAGKVRAFGFHVWSGVEKPHCWRMGWCFDHKTVSYEVYVPSRTNVLAFHPHFGDHLDIHFDHVEKES